MADSIFKTESFLFIRSFECLVSLMTAFGIFTTCLLITTTLISAQERSPKAPRRDHVLLITIDDLNDWIGCLSETADTDKTGKFITGQGHPQARTPHLDALAKRGVLFTNAHCQAPICKPSRASIFSGLRPSTTGLYGNRPQFDAKSEVRPGQEVPWLTERFSDSGYEVFTAGKLLHASRNKPLGGTACFQTNQGPYPKEKIEVPPEITPARVWDIGRYPAKEEDYTDLRIAKWTAGNISKPLTESDQPRFMALGFYNPHLPLFAPSKWFEAAPKKEDVILAHNREGDRDDLSEIARRINSRVSFSRCADWALSDEKNQRTLTQAYLACTTAMDDALGHVIAALDQSEMAETTWIIVLSDHGWHLGEKNCIAKQTLWTRSTRVPLIVVPPKRLGKMARGRRCDRAVELLDIYPTLVDGAKLPNAQSDQLLEGVSLLPWLEDPAAKRKRPAITTIYAHNHSLCDTRWRYTRYADGSEELYDRENDYHEVNNLIGQKDQRPDLQEVVKRLSAWIPKKEVRGPDLLIEKKEN